MGECKHDGINKVNYVDDNTYYCHACKKHISYGEYVTALENKIERFFENKNISAIKKEAKKLVHWESDVEKSINILESHDFMEDNVGLETLKDFLKTIKSEREYYDQFLEKDVFSFYCSSCKEIFTDNKSGKRNVCTPCISKSVKKVSNERKPLGETKYWGDKS